MNSNHKNTKTQFFQNFQLLKCIQLILGLFILALGVSLSVKADLGVTPISCVPYVYSIVVPFSLGELTIFMNAIFILLQIAILRKKYRYIQLIQFLGQLLVVILLGYFIDFTLYLISGINPTTYLGQLVILLISCAFVALGVFLFVKANITYIPCDGLLVVISKTFKKDFGKVKICIDSSMVIIGVVSSFVFLHKLAGIREGTIIAAFIVGLLVQLYGKISHFLSRKLPRTAKPGKITGIPKNYVITISREYGSGGHEIGQCIAKKLGISFYDKELINITAEKSGFTREYIRENEQKIKNTLFYELYAQNYAYINGQLPPTETLFLIQSKVVHDICSKESCVIVGRCANFVLKDNPNCFNVYVHADNEFRKSRITNYHKGKTTVSNKDLDQSDRERSNYCKKYTGLNWRDSTNYHITINSSLFTIEQIADSLIYLLQRTKFETLEEGKSICEEKMIA